MERAQGCYGWTIRHYNLSRSPTQTFYVRKILCLSTQLMIQLSLFFPPKTAMFQQIVSFMSVFSTFTVCFLVDHAFTGLCSFIFKRPPPPPSTHTHTHASTSSPLKGLLSLLRLPVRPLTVHIHPDTVPSEAFIHTRSQPPLPSCMAPLIPHLDSRYPFPPYTHHIFHPPQHLQSTYFGLLPSHHHHSFRTFSKQINRNSTIIGISKYRLLCV